MSKRRSTRTAVPSSPPTGTRAGPTWTRVAWIAASVAAAVLLVGFVVWQSVDQASDAPAPWARLNTQDVHSLAFVNNSDSELLFGHHGGLLHSTDGGENWAPLSVKQDAMGLSASPDGSIVIAGHLVFQASRDGGATWAPIDAKLPSLDIHSFTRSLGQPSTMWAYLAEGGVWKSDDFGANWIEMNAGHVQQLTAIRRNGVDELLGIDNRGLVKTSDDGATWVAVGTPPTAPVTSLAAMSDGMVIIMGGPDGLYRSDDAGDSWLKILSSDLVLATAISTDGRTVAAVTRDTNFYRSDDGGATWSGPP